MKMDRIWIDDLGTWLIPDSVTFHQKKDGGVDRRYTVQNRPLFAWVEEMRQKYIRGEI